MRAKAKALVTSLETAMRRKLQLLFVLVTGSYALLLALHLLLRFVAKDATWYLAFVNQFTPFYFLPLIVLLPLALAFKTRRVALQLLVLLVIGAATYGPRFIPRATAATNGDTLRVITFNIWALNGRLGDVEQWLREQDADVLLLQEVTAQIYQFADTSLQDLYPYQSLPSARGNVTLSKHPILSEELFQVGSSPNSQHRLTLDIDGQTVAVYNIHLDVPTQDRPHRRLPEIHPVVSLAVRFNPIERDRQIRDLVNILAGESNPYIVAGDFNTSDQSAIYEELAAAMGDSFAEAGFGMGTSWRTDVDPSTPFFLPPLVRIDYIWHSDDFQAVSAQQGPVLGSDHLPLVATLALAE
jgi:vancomycin resistance protein VanJ